jgi:hypothetical protein
MLAPMGNDPKKPSPPINSTFTTPLWRAALTDPSKVVLLDPHPTPPKPGAPP